MICDNCKNDLSEYEKHPKYYYILWELDIEFARSNNKGIVYSKEEAQTWKDQNRAFRSWHEHIREAPIINIHT